MAVRYIEDKVDTRNKSNSIEIGDTFRFGDNYLEIKDIWIVISEYDYSPECFVEYKYNVDGRSGIETNSMVTLARYIYEDGWLGNKD